MRILDRHHIPMSVPVLIPVSGNNYALVDPEDAERVLQHKWFISHSGYAVRQRKLGEEDPDNGIFYKDCCSMHRFILTPGKGSQIDHINGCGLDNRKCNLRLCTQSQNCANSILIKAPSEKVFRAKKTRVCTSKYRGVSWRSDRNRWTAYVGTGKGRIMLGCFESEIEAALAYNRKAEEVYGEFAKLNVVDGQ